MRSGRRFKRVGDAAVEQAEVADVGGHVDRGDALQHPIEDLDQEEAERALAGPLGAHRRHDVEAFAPLGDQLGDDLGRILQVGVDHHHGAAAGVLDAGRDGRLVAEVAAEAQDADARVAVGGGEQDRRRLVDRAVVDEDDLVIGARRFEHGEEAMLQLGQDGGLVEDRDDDRELGSRRAAGVARAAAPAMLRPGARRGRRPRRRPADASASAVDPRRRRRASACRSPVRASSS